MVGATTSFLFAFIGVAPVAAVTTAPVLPPYSELYGVGYDTHKVGQINTVDSTVSFLPGDIGDAVQAEGAGFDAATGRTWIMQDCELFAMNPDGSTQSVHNVIGVNSLDLTQCWGFTPVGDGSAYLTARLDVPLDGNGDPTVPEPALYSTLFRVSLFSGEIMSDPVPIDVDMQTDSGGQPIDAHLMEPTDLAFNSATGDLWVTTYASYVYLLNPSHGSVSNIFEGFIAQNEWSWGMAVDPNNVLWLFVGDDVSWNQLVTLAPDNNWQRYDFPDVTVPGSNEVFNTDAMWIRDTTPVEGTGHVINISVTCDSPIDVTADIGDTLVFTLQHEGCDGSNYWDDPAGNFANFNNLNGTYFSDYETGGQMPYQGTATGSGFLTYVGHTQNTKMSYDYWGRIANGSQDDWYVLQTPHGGDDVVITTVLRAVDGNGSALAVGSVIANVFTEPAEVSPEEFLVTYAGPRSGNVQATSNGGATLANTGISYGDWLGTSLLTL